MIAILFQVKKMIMMRGIIYCQDFARIVNDLL